MNLDGVFTPILQESADGTRGPAERDDAAAIKTYRYLRLGMVVVAFAILVAVREEVSRSGELRGSVSDYYYSHPRPVFVAGLVSIAVALIVIKGNTVVEDTLLNIAGLLAPVVAFVPTGSERVCDVQPATVPTPDICLDVQNNMKAFLAAGALAVAIGLVALVLDRKGRHVTTTIAAIQAFLLAGTIAVIAVGWWTLERGMLYGLHATSAIAMFVALGLASLMAGGALLWINRDRAPDQRTPRWSTAAAISYLVVAFAMLIGGAYIYLTFDETHRVLWLEVYETVIFALMWITQSVERWGSVLR